MSRLSFKILPIEKYQKTTSQDTIEDEEDFFGWEDEEQVPQTPTQPKKPPTPPPTIEAPWAQVKPQVVSFREVSLQQLKLSQGTQHNVEVVKNFGGKIDLLKKSESENRLIRTKFCQNMVNTGRCTYRNCGYVHKLNELNFPQCMFGNGCKKNNCSFLHPKENIEDYKIRVNFTIPKNIY